VQFLIIMTNSNKFFKRFVMTSTNPSLWSLTTSVKWQYSGDMVIIDLPRVQVGSHLKCTYRNSWIHSNYFREYYVGQRSKLHYNYIGCQAKITCFKPANCTNVKITGVYLEHDHEIRREKYSMMLRVALSITSLVTHHGTSTFLTYLGIDSHLLKPP